MGSITSPSIFASYTPIGLPVAMRSAAQPPQLCPSFEPSGLQARSGLPVRHSGRVSTLAVLSMLGLLIISQSGCLGMMSNFMHAVGADRVPAEYEGFKDAKIAIVTMTDRSQYSDDIVARLLNRKLSNLLLNKVKGATLVREDQVQQWRDVHGLDNDDFTQMGKDLEADQVLVIELTDLKLRDGATLYRGHAGIVMTVYEMESGSVAFRKEIDEFTYPVSAGQYTSETTEPKFRKLFLSMLAERLARVFHPYDFADTIALDGAIASQ